MEQLGIGVVQSACFNYMEKLDANIYKSSSNSKIFTYCIVADLRRDSTLSFYHFRTNFDEEIRRLQLSAIGVLV